MTGRGTWNWQSVAEKDLRDAIRARSILLLGVVFVFLFLGVSGLASVYGDDVFADFLTLAAPVVVFVVPIVAFGVAYKAILNERRRDTIVLSLSLPHSRLDLLVGTLVGRSVVLALPVAAGLALGWLILAVVGGGAGESANYLRFAVASLLYGVAYLGFALGLSASTASSRRVTLLAIGAYVVFVTVFRELVTVLVLLIYRFDAPNTSPDWAVLLQMLSPTEAYLFLLDGMAGFEVAGVAAMADPPWFAAWWLAVLVLLAWVAVPVALGYRRFRRAEL